MRTIPGHHGYFATEEGHIYSTRRGHAKKLSGYVNQDGYLTVTVTADDGIKRKTLVHRLILLAYHGDSPEAKSIGRHLNGEQLDNRPANLEWGNAFDNYMDAVEHGTRANGRGIGGRITPPEIVRNIRADAMSGDADEVIAKRYGISKTQVYRIRTKKRWAAVV